MAYFGCFCEFYINNLLLFFTVFTVKWNWEFIQALQGRQQKKIKKIKDTAHLKQHSYLMAIFSFGMKIFKIAFQHDEDNSCMVPIAPFSTTNFSHMTLF